MRDRMLRMILWILGVLTVVIVLVMIYARAVSSVAPPEGISYVDTAAVVQ